MQESFKEEALSPPLIGWLFNSCVRKYSGSFVPSELSKCLHQGMYFCFSLCKTFDTEDMKASKHVFLGSSQNGLKECACGVFALEDAVA